jgi:hypothetical protein
MDYSAKVIADGVVDSPPSHSRIPLMVSFPSPLRGKNKACYAYSKLRCWFKTFLQAIWFTFFFCSKCIGEGIFIRIMCFEIVIISILYIDKFFAWTFTHHFVVLTSSSISREVHLNPNILVLIDLIALPHPLYSGIFHNAILHLSGPVELRPLPQRLETPI